MHGFLPKRVVKNGKREVIRAADRRISLLLKGSFEIRTFNLLSSTSYFRALFAEARRASPSFSSKAFILSP